MTSSKSTATSAPVLPPTFGPNDKEMVTLINRTRNIIGNDAMQQILQYAIWWGSDQGYKLGYDEGYHKATGYGIIDANDGWEAGYAEGQEFGLKEGEERGKVAQRENWEMNHGPDRCKEQWTQLQMVKIDKGIQTEPASGVTTNLSTQTTATSVDAVIQMATNDNTAASLLPPPPFTTSSLTIHAQPPSTMTNSSSTTTTAFPPASEPPPGPQE